MKSYKINFKSVWVLAGLLAALLLRPAVLEAAVIAYDPFLNETAANLANADTNGSYNDLEWRTFASATHNSCAGGPIVGWTAAELWNQNYPGGGDLISPSGKTGLSFGENVVQGGHARFRAVSPGGVSYARRALASYTANNTYYMSALVRQNADLLDRWYNLKGMTGFTSSLTTNAYDGTLFSGVLYGFWGNGDSVNPRLDLVVRHQDASGAMVNSTLLSGADPDATYFIVVKIESDVSSGLDRLTAWLNPAGREESNTAAVTTLGNILADTSSITQAGIFSDGLWDISTVWTDFDEIRFSTEWSDAVAVFEPANLSIQSGDGSVVVSSIDLEPNASHMLQVSDDLTNGIWSDFHAVVGTNSMNWTMTPLPNAQCFYRIQSRLDGVHRFYQRAEPASFPPGAPRLSDVCMRLFRIRDDITEERIITAGKDYHITWGSWSYINDAAFIAQVNALGWRFQGTLNGNTYVSDYALVDYSGRPIPSPTGTGYYGDPSNTGYRAEYLQTAKDWIDNGATSLQRDDPEFGEWYWRGSRDVIPDAELLEFHSWARDEIEAYAGQTISMSVNSSEDHPFMESFDYRMVEVRFDGLSPSSLLNISREARRQDMITVVTGQEDRPVDEFRLAWAGTYATGDLFMVPWDQFNREQVTDPSAPRIFIEPAEMADLTGFVRANALYLDGYEDAAIGGYDLVETRYGNEEPPLTVEGGSGQLSALLRACPGDPAAPLVIHLVEWGSSAPAVIKLRSELLFGSSPVQVRLHIPAAYDAGAHALAETSKDYSSLSVEEELVPSVQGDWTSIQVPALAPWGILVIGKQE